MSHLTTAEELAHQFGITVEKLHELRLKKQWPHVRLTRFDVRFTREQVEQIIAMQTVAPTSNDESVVALPGQTARSAGRSA